MKDILSNNPVQNVLHKVDEDILGNNPVQTVLNKVDERHFGQTAGSNCPSYVKN
jgi:hypothetical protein